MKKTTLIVFLLAMLAPVMQTWGTTYYYKLHLEVSSASTGSGLVYAATSNSDSGATYKSSSDAVPSRSRDSSVNTGYAFAKANYGSVFKGWATANGTLSTTTSNNPYNPTVTATGTSSSSPAPTQNYYAVFVPNPDSYTLTLNKPEGLGSYTVTGPSGFSADLSQGGSATVYKGDQYTFKYTLSSDEYDFINWTVNGEQKSGNPVSVTISSDTTIVLTLRKKITYTATCQGSIGGSYKANGTTVSGSDQELSNYASITVDLSNPVANSGYTFYGWYILHPNGVKEYLSYFTSASTGEKKENIVVGAEFREVVDCTVNFEAPDEGKIAYAISGGNFGEVDDADKSETVPAGADVTLTATSDFESRRAKWYTRDDGNEKVYFSIDSTLTKQFSSSVTLGVDFVPVNTNIVNAIEAAQSSPTHAAILAADAEIVLDTSVEIPSGITVDLNGHTLYVDGTLTVNGTLTGGTVSKCQKLLKQTGEGLSPCNPYGSIKYWKTDHVTSSATITGLSGTATHVTIMRGDGVAIRKVYTDSPAVLKCKADATIAANHITSITSTDTGKSRSSDGLTCPPGSGDPESITQIQTIDMLMIVDSGVSIYGQAKSGDSQGRYYYQGVVDCAGYDCGGMSKDIMSDYIVTFLNGNSVSVGSAKFQNATVRFCNCQSVSTGKARNTPHYFFYDCTLSSLSFTKHSDGGTADAKFLGGKYDYGFGGITDAASRIYAGGFSPKPDKDTWVIEKLRSTMTFAQHADGYWYLEPNQDPSVAKIGETKYLTIEEALAYLNDNDSATMTLLRDVTLATPYTLVAGKSLVIELGGCHVNAPNGFVKNYGSLSIRNNNNSLAVSGVTVGSGKNIVENYGDGTVDICYGVYEGNFEMNGGLLTTHHGKFIGSVANNGGTMNLKGGIFSSDVSALLNEGYHAFFYGGWYYAGRFPKPEEESSSLSDFARVLTAMPSEDKTLYLAKKTYSLESCSSVDEWKNVAELKAAYALFEEFYFDILVGFDRDIAANTVQAKVRIRGMSQSENFPAMSAGELERVFSPRITQTPISYARFIYDNGEGNYDTMEAGIADINNANNGTVCVLAMDLWKYHNKTKTTKDSYLTLLVLPHVFGAGNNVAMIRPAAGAATFYGTLGAAMGAVADGGTVMLANDCTDPLPLTKEGTYTFDPMGFAHSDEISLGDGLSCTVEEVDSSVKALIPSTVAKKYVVTRRIATVGETGYGTLAAAVAGTSAENGTVKLVGNCSENVVISEARAFTLDTNGKSFTGTVTAGEGYSLASATSGNTTTYVVVKGMPAVTSATGSTLGISALETLPAGYAVAKYKVDGVEETNPEVSLPESGYKTFTVKEVLTKDGSSVELDVAHSVGVLKVESTAETTVIAVPWYAFDDDGTTVKVDSLVYLVNRDVGDMLKAYNATTGNYDSWVLTERDGGKVWAPMTTVGGTTTEADPASEASVTRGQGLLLTRKDVTKPIYLVGRADGTATKTVTLANGNNLVAPPSLTGLNLNEAFSSPGSDEIVVPTTGAPKIYTYANGSWGYDDVITETRTIRGQTVTVVVGTERKTDDVVVPPGKGFIYDNKGESAKSVEW